MDARITILTLGVDDPEKALRLYRDGLGLATDGIVGEQFEYGAVGSTCLNLSHPRYASLIPQRTVQ